MPAVQVLDLNPAPRTELTPLEKTLSTFAQGYTKQREEQRESDALKDIYQKYQGDAMNIRGKIEEITADPRISPTTRVKTIDSLLKAEQYNSQLMKQAKEDQEKAQKKESNKAIIADLEKRRGYQPGELSAYEDNPAMAATITKPEKGATPTQASQPIAPDQLQRIQHVESKPEFASASNPQKSKMLRDAGVSKENNESIMKSYEQEEKPASIRAEALAQAQAKEDIGFVSEQVSKIPTLAKQQEVLNEAARLNEEDATGKNWDILMQKAGLVQYTSEGFREFSSFAKEAVKNANIKGIIGSQISQMEFNFFRDATINPNFSKEANNRILRKENAALRYDKLYADITDQMVKDNNGQIPERVQQKVNEEFARQSQKISKDVKQAADEFQAIQHVPKGFTLMYDDKRKPLHVPNDQVAQAVKDGASSK